jgi:23S rRNA-/tRNA-specific pseudouridylate synthase
VVLKKTVDYVVVDKPPSVVCHHSDWTGSKSMNETPMLQRVRDAVNGGAATGDTAVMPSDAKRRVNLIHRIDRGCSGCLLFSIVPPPHPSELQRTADLVGLDGRCESHDSDDSVTARLIRAMQSRDSIKTYVALVRGEGVLHGQDLREWGWFLVDRPIRDETGRLNEASTWFRFVAGQDDAGSTRPRASVVLCRPVTGRWHQVRRHLNGLSHPILGDSSHGNSKVNRMWRCRYGMLPERTCLHLARLQIRVGGNDIAGSAHPPTVPVIKTKWEIDVACPLAPDMKRMLERHLPTVLEEALPVFQEEGIVL